MLRLPTWRWPSHRTVGVYCVLVFADNTESQRLVPETTETRWLDKVPTPGTRIRSREGWGYWGQTWVVDEVLQSGRDTYTVFCVGQSRYLDKLRNRPGLQPDLASELLEAARRTRETVAQGRRRWKYRRYIP
jgi:hypothetical protein